MTKAVKGLFSWIWKHKVIFLVVLTEIAIYIRALYMGSIMPFGKLTFTWGDANTQYSAFLSEYKRMLLNGGISGFTWNSGLGTEFIPLWGYYLTSPINLFAIFVDSVDMLQFVIVLVGIRMVLASITMYIFLYKKYDNNKIESGIIAMAYGFSSYALIYGFNIMWMDTYVLLPLIILGLERLYNDTKKGLYYITLALSIFCGYYISISVCIFLVLYFIVLFINDDSGLKDKLNKFKNFAIYSILAGCTSAIFLIPTIIYTKYCKNSDSIDINSLIKFNSNFMQIIENMLTSYKKTNEDHNMLIFCSVFAMIGIILFIFTKRNSIKYKISILSLWLIMIIVQIFGLGDYVFSGFHVNRMVECRFSFIIVFLSLSMTYITLCEIRQLGKLKTMVAFIITAGLIGLLYCFHDNVDGYSEKVIALSLIFLLCYFIVVFLYVGGEKTRRVFLIIMFCVMSYELYTNTYEYIYENGNGGSEKNIQSCMERLVEKADKEDKEDNEDKEDKTDGSGFYRMNIGYKLNYINMGMKLNEKNLNFFNSYCNNNIVNFYKKSGQSSSGTSCGAMSEGETFILSILNCKYDIIEPANSVIDDFKLIDEDTAVIGSIHKGKLDYNVEEIIKLYENEYYLGLGYIVNTNFVSDFEVSDYDNMLEYKNNILKSMTGLEDDLYIIIDDDIENSIEVDKSEEYGLIIKDIDKYTGEEIYIEDNENITTINIDGSEYKEYDIANGIIPYFLGTLKEGTKITFSFDPSERGIGLYRTNSDVLQEGLSILSENTMDVVDYNDTYLKGKINVTKEGALFTSIPYSKGWTVFLDGKEVEPEVFEDAFIVLPDMELGEHTVEFKYHVPGLKAGIAVSSLSVIIFIALMVYEKKKSKQENKQESE